MQGLFNSCAVCFVCPCVSQTVKQKLEDATNNTKTWKHKVAEQEGLLRLIQPGNSSTLTTVCCTSNLCEDKSE